MKSTEERIFSIQKKYAKRLNEEKKRKKNMHRAIPLVAVAVLALAIAPLLLTIFTPAGSTAPNSDIANIPTKARENEDSMSPIAREKIQRIDVQKAKGFSSPAEVENWLYEEKYTFQIYRDTGVDTLEDFSKDLSLANEIEWNERTYQEQEELSLKNTFVKTAEYENLFLASLLDETSGESQYFLLEKDQSPDASNKNIALEIIETYLEQNK